MRKIQNGEYFCVLRPLPLPPQPIKRLEVAVLRKSACVWSVRASVTLVLLGCLAGCGSGSGPTSRFLVTLTVNDQEVGSSDFVIDNHAATMTTDGEVERFDLRHESWFDESRNKWITLSESRAWTEGAIARSRQTVDARASADTRPLLEWMISPRFDVTREGDFLLLKSGFLDYRIKVAPGGPELKNYIRFARLNAYKKAMTLHQNLPLAELLVTEELETRNLIPLRTEVTFVLRGDTRSAIVELTPVDAGR